MRLATISLLAFVGCSKTDPPPTDAPNAYDQAVTQGMIRQHDCDALRAVIDPAQQKLAALADNSYDAKHYVALADAREETVATLKKLSFGDPDVSKIADDYRALNEQMVPLERAVAASLDPKADAAAQTDADGMFALSTKEMEILGRFDKACARMVVK